MSRSREFNPEEALDKAMLLFWERGYEKTSFDDLVEATQVSRYGLYNEFGDKRELFLKALERYTNSVLMTLRPQLLMENATIADIKALFRSGLDCCFGPNGARGCMLCTTAIELGPDDPALAKMILMVYRDMSKVMAKALRNSQLNGEIAADIDPVAVAEFLIGSYQGAMVLARTGASRAHLQRYVATATKLLG